MHAHQIIIVIQDIHAILMMVNVMHLHLQTQEQHIVLLTHHVLMDINVKLMEFVIKIH